MLFWIIIIFFLKAECVWLCFRVGKQLISFLLSEGFPPTSPNTKKLLQMSHFFLAGLRRGREKKKKKKNSHVLK